MPKTIGDTKSKQYAKTLSEKVLKWGGTEWSKLNTTDRVKILCKVLDKVMAIPLIDQSEHKHYVFGWRKNGESLPELRERISSQGMAGEESQDKRK